MALGTVGFEKLGVQAIGYFFATWAMGASL
jgi:hypothetical protein